MAETVNFDQEPVGALPAGWIAGVTGRGTPHWAIENDTSAPTAKHVLKQSGSGAFPWCVKKDVSVADGSVEVKFKSISGTSYAVSPGRYSNVIAKLFSHFPFPGVPGSSVIIGGPPWPRTTRAAHARPRATAKCRTSSLLLTPPDRTQAA